MNIAIRNIFIASLISASIIASAAFFAAPASALTVDDIQAQIKELLAKISGLQEQLRIAQGGQSQTPPSDITVTAVPRICTTLPAFAVAYGARGEAVSDLQEFLRSEGYLNANATGYFGVATQGALARWQAAQGLDSVGALGPMTRASIRARCGNASALSVTPQSGQAPLTVVVTSTVGDATSYRPSIADGQDTLIDFGDGSERQWVQCAVVLNDQFGGQTSGGKCTTPVSFKHTYTQNGTYTVKLLQAGGMCMGGCPERFIASAYVTVGNAPTSANFSASPNSGAAPLSVSFSYQPSEESGQYYIEYGDGSGEQMTTQQIYCIRAPCISPATAKHVYAKAGTYTATVNRYIACLYSNPRCMMAQPAPLASVQITVTGTSNNSAPSISSLSGPTTLAVNEAGTWTIRASDPENQQLTYSITWGDEFYGANAGSGSASAREVFPQTTTFSHTYARSGTYTVSVVVQDASGLEARTSTTVRVGGGDTACTKEYRPVCGRPKGCANTCPAGMYCTMMCRLYDPVTYGNRCELNAANADYLYDGQCQTNAY